MIQAALNWFGSETGQFVLFSALKILGVFSVVMFIVAYAVWVERRTAAFIQDRLGPNRVGPLGLLQPAADAIKAFLKEDFTPAHVRKVYYWLAPAIVMIPSLLTVAIIPFGSLLGSQKMVIADLNVGILYTFGIVSLGVYGIVLAGYAARSHRRISASRCASGSSRKPRASARAAPRAATSSSGRARTRSTATCRARTTPSMAPGCATTVA